jgi:hypothetical protein
MSKTKGNVIDPVSIVEKYGTDAVRFTLASMASPGTDIAFSEARTEGYRAFANKIWNAARFIFMNVERAREAGIEVDRVRPRPDADRPRQAPHSKRAGSSPASNLVAAQINDSLAAYRFDEAANHLPVLLGDFCDWYLEIVKLRLDFRGLGQRSRPKPRSPRWSRSSNPPAATLAIYALPYRRALARHLRRRAARESPSRWFGIPWNRSLRLTNSQHRSNGKAAGSNSNSRALRKDLECTKREVPMLVPIQRQPGLCDQSERIDRGKF